MTKTPSALQKILAQAKRQWRWQQTIRLLLPVLTLGLIGTLLLTLLGRLLPLAMPNNLLTWGLGATILALGLTWAYVWLRPISAQRLARQLDYRLKLDERLSTTLHLIETDSVNTPDHITQAQLNDTLSHLPQLNLKQAFPHHHQWRWLIVTTILIGLLVVNISLPNRQVQVLHQQLATQQLIDEQLTRFEDIRTDLLTDETLLETPDGEELQQSLNNLIDTLQEENISLEEAMAAISEAEENLTSLENIESTDTQPQDTLNDLAQSFSQFDSTTDLAAALEQHNLTEAAETLRAAANNLPNDPQSTEDLAQALQQAAETAATTGHTELAEALTEAAEALEQALETQNSNENQSDQGSQTDQVAAQQAVQQALQQAAQALEQAGQQLADQEAIQQALANIQEARQQLAQQSTQGQGQQPGQGSGDGEGNIGEAGRGDPATDGAEGLFTVEGAPDSMSIENGPNEGQAEVYKSLYAPEHLGGEGGPLVNPDSPDTEGGIPIGEAPVDPNQDPGEALVPYNQIYGQYNNAASQALDDSYIPLGMKSYVRQYFGALEPE